MFFVSFRIELFLKFPVYYIFENYSRFIKVDPEAALDSTNKKFYDRFNKMEEMAMQEKKLLSDMTLVEMDALWNETKKIIP